MYYTVLYCTVYCTVRYCTAVYVFLRILEESLTPRACDQCYSSRPYFQQPTQLTHTKRPPIHTAAALFIVSSSTPIAFAISAEAHHRIIASQLFWWAEYARRTYLSIDKTHTGYVQLDQRNKWTHDNGASGEMTLDTVPRFWQDITITRVRYGAPYDSLRAGASIYNVSRFFVVVEQYQIVQLYHSTVFVICPNK